jgi:hypothetical protein
MNRAREREGQGPLTFRKVTERLRSCYYIARQRVFCRNSERETKGGSQDGREGEEGQGRRAQTGPNGDVPE